MTKRIKKLAYFFKRFFRIYDRPQHKYDYIKYWNQRALYSEGHGKVIPPSMTKKEVDFETNRQVKIIKKYCPHTRSKILDAGCGIGRISKKLYESGHSIYGIDSSKIMISIAKESCPDVKFIVADLKNMPFSENFFDLVFELSVLLHVPDEIIEEVASEFKRVSNDRILIFPSADFFENSDYYFFRDTKFYENLFKPFKLERSELLISKWGRCKVMLFKKEEK